VVGAHVVVVVACFVVVVAYPAVPTGGAAAPGAANAPVATIAAPAVRRSNPARPRALRPAGSKPQTCAHRARRAASSRERRVISPPRTRSSVPGVPAARYRGAGTSDQTSARAVPATLAVVPATRELLSRAARVVLDERRALTPDELSPLAALPDQGVPALAALAHDVRLAWCGPTVEVEGIVSAKTGGCPEDCHFCSQSARFESPVQATPLLDLGDVIAAANETAALGASEFCLVFAVRGPDERLLEWLCDTVPRVRDATGLNIAVSAGILDDEQARRLAAAGTHRYNHNLETARSFFGRIVTTHTWEERFATCTRVRAHGMELCCGALLGMGESVEQRIELLGQLQSVGPAEVPINFLNPRPGTPLGDRAPVEPLDALRWIALFRLALPGVILRYAGGREITLRELQALGLTAGVNALIIGNYLTTLGRAPAEDLRMLADLRMPVGVLGKVL
jgi:biotin synthase